MIALRVVSSLLLSFLVRVKQPATRHSRYLAFTRARLSFFVQYSLSRTLICDSSTDGWSKPDFDKEILVRPMTAALLQRVDNQ
jgi:hypothetical protein